MKYNRVANWLYFIHKRIGCSEEHTAELAHARYEEKKLDEHRSRVGHTIHSPIVLSDKGGEDKDDTGRLRELIALAETGKQAQEAKDDTGILSKLIALAEAAFRHRRLTMTLADWASSSL